MPVGTQDAIHLPQEGVRIIGQLQGMGQQHCIHGIRGDGQRIYSRYDICTRYGRLAEDRCATCPRQPPEQTRVAPRSDLEKLITENTVERTANLPHFLTQQVTAGERTQPPGGLYHALLAFARSFGAALCNQRPGYRYIIPEAATSGRRPLGL